VDDTDEGILDGNRGMPNPTQEDGDLDGDDDVDDDDLTLLLAQDGLDLEVVS
jgi:hypothetical protein